MVLAIFSFVTGLLYLADQGLAIKLCIGKMVAKKAEQDAMRAIRRHVEVFLLQI